MQVCEPRNLALWNPQHGAQFGHGEGLVGDVVEVHQAGDVLEQQDRILR